MKELFEFSLYLLYGLVFFAIGFSIYFRDMRFSHLSIASALPTLAIFGFIHGLHEWSEMYLHIYSQDLEMHNTVKIFKVAKLWASFIALGYFAIQMLAMTKWRLKTSYSILNTSHHNYIFLQCNLSSTSQQTQTVSYKRRLKRYAGFLVQVLGRIQQALH